MALAYTAIAGSRDVLVEAVNAGTDQWAFALASSVPGSVAFVSGTTDLSTAGGYTAGGNNVATVSSSESGGVYKLILATPATWVATGSGFSFRYILLVDKTTNNVLGYWDYGSTITMSASDEFTFTPDATNGVFSVT